jgi:SepF-like predicted cell division protein (DUF552 family)
LLIGIITLVIILAYIRSHRVNIHSQDGKKLLDRFWVLAGKDKSDGTIWWKSVFWQKKFKIIEPPDEVIKVNKKGKFEINLYRITEDEYIYNLDTGINKDDILVSNGQKLSDGYKPFSAVQRQVVVQEFIKAEAEKPQSWLKENAMNLASMSAMLLIIIIGIVYWGDIATFTLEKDQASTSALNQVNQLLKEFNGDVQSIKPESNPILVSPNENPPEE